ADLEESDRRQRVLDMLDAVTNFGVHDVPEGRKAAYGDIVAPGETAAMRAALLAKTPQNPSCGLLVRTAWPMPGATDERGPLLDPPYLPGTVMENLVKFAQKHGALTQPKPGDDIAPQPGDVLLIRAGNHQHVLTVYGVGEDGVTITSVDGGQGNPCATVDDGS